MNNAQQHWKILSKLGKDLAKKVRSFLVIGDEGEGVMVATEDGQGYWLGKMEFGRESRTTNEPTPLDVPELVQMAQSQNHILLLNKRGQIYSMGRNDFGQLGLGTADHEARFTPQLISSPQKFVSVRCGESHNLALTEDGMVWSWGELGMSDPISNLNLSPRQIPGLDSHQVVAVECGFCHSLALTDQGEVYGWGTNNYGQLGNRNGSTSDTPTRIFTPSPVKSIAAGENHTLLLTKTGEVYSYGNNGGAKHDHLTDTESTADLTKVEGLPPISQIASHPATELSIAISSDQRCFVWGYLCDIKDINHSRNSKYGTVVSTPRVMPPVYSTVDSPLSFYSTKLNTPHSVTILETPPNPLSARMSRLFDNPENSDVQFLVEEKTIHAHRIILSNCSDYFARMFSETWLSPVDPEDPIVRVTIPDHSYKIFYAFLYVIYTDYFKFQPDLLSDLFELAIQYLVPDMQRLCISQMRTTLTPATCCLYYQLTHRHPLPELVTFQHDLVQFASTQMSEVITTDSYQSMDADLCKKLIVSIANLDTCNYNDFS